MSETKYVYFWQDNSSWILNTGFYIYTEKQVSDYMKNNTTFKFTRLGYDTDMNDLSFAMYKKMEYNIIEENSYRDNNTVYESHSHVAVLSTILPDWSESIKSFHTEIQLADHIRPFTFRWFSEDFSAIRALIYSTEA